ncbi:Ger(x)C family germination protein [Ureibacillus xyleni]|uniref:Ger(X)C family germination protein n=1 Tax=Ureibacillus xyleni TaxID=614648 RepID=A0A285T3K5_9BACL|nr:Ger(x)C family spore germination protein [Ureibacillus xyleni]SOC15901.1 Ger(x)C family germination protein [Ureibacillus xyleni]
MTKVKKVILLFWLCTILSGCWDLKEVERMFYIHGLGVDYKDGLYEITFQLISFSNVAKTEQVNQDVIQSEVSTAKGKTPDEAIFDLYHAIDEVVYWGHLQFIVFSDEVLKEKRLDPVINMITRFRDTRYQTWVYSTDKSIEDFLLVTPLLKRSITLTKLADPLNSYDQASFVKPITLRQLIIELNEPNHEARMPAIKLKEDWKTQKGPDKSVEFEGYGVVSKLGFKGFIKDDDAHGIQWVMEETKRGQITTTTKGNQDLTIIIQNVKPKIIPIVNGDSVKFDIDVRLTGSLNDFIGDLKSDEIKEVIRKKVAEEILVSYKAALEKNIDIYRLSEVLYRDNVKLWKKIHKDGIIPLTEDSIRNINIKVEKLDTGRKSFEDTIE